METRLSRNPVRRRVFLVLLFLVSAAVSYVALTAPQILALSSDSFQVGQVASTEVLAPREITYESQVLTEEQREAAAHAVPPLYTPADTAVARQQLERLRAALAFINSVRADIYATPEQKIQDLVAL